MKTFKRGGVHPPEHKEITEGKAIEVLPVPDLLYVSVSQHIGAPAKPVVEVGSAVKMGQLIAEASGFVSTNMHSPVSGKVRSIVKIQNILGRSVDHIVIENDHLEEWGEKLNQYRSWEDLSSEDLVNIVCDSGVVGMGGAAFPTHVKLSPPEGKKIDTLVINGVECEPYLTCDHRLMLEKPDELISGIKIIKKILGAERVIVGIEANKKDAADKLKTALCSEKGIDIELLEVKYPQGAEKQLIVSVLKREVPSGKLPMDVGVVVQNVATCLAVYEAVVLNKPLIERAVTVSGDGVETPGNYLIRVGTPTKFVFDKVGLKKKIRKLISGGPMMGVAFFNMELPVLKGTSGILAFRKVPDYVPYECIRCGKCIQACPYGWMPSEIARAVKAGHKSDYEDLHIVDCVECGSCAYVCPARIPLVQYVKQAKEEILAMKRKNK